jgi:hypothetical protein
MRVLPSLLVMALWAGPPMAAQQHPDVAAARQAYQSLDYRLAIAAARRALAQPRLSAEDRATAYELLAFTYGALDSTTQAVDAFRELIFIDPDREPDPRAISPRITALYANALGQVLVVRRIEADTVSFVAGQGEIPIMFDVTRRPARVTARAVGNGFDAVIATDTVVDRGHITWTATDQLGAPVPAGRYRILIEAAVGPDQYTSQVVLDLQHGTVDTLPHVSSLEGYTLQNEYEQPGRNWKPLGLAALYTALASGASLALENTNLANPPRREIGGVSLAVLVTGFVMSLQRPDSVPVPANILYNQLFRERLADENAEIAAQNARRRRQVMLTIVPVNEPQ